MTTSLSDFPEIIRTYLDSKTGADATATTACFAADATVHDEGHDHVGTDAIQTWATKISTNFRLTRSVLGVRQTGTATILRVEVSGNFPGSPVVLHHHFSTADNLIVALTICI